ncbi:hypothetical protein P12x_003478 [Tundrisphaera lichenicola]|uniref:hypothetical protein n=1 Tax=Tundrisphaera lichenicola TaxID=2029860 RepID=UPI003EB778AA
MSTDSRPHRRLILVLASLALAGLSAWIGGRLISLDGLPDIGDPFDVEAFSRPIPDETNAYVLYRQAAEKLTREPQDLQGHWEAAGEAERKWLFDNHEAMEIWRRGTERPDALYILPLELKFTTLLPVSQALRSFTRLATLEGTRLEGEGKYEEALGWYLAILRSSRHSGKRATAIERLIGIAMHGIACQRISSLAARPEVGTSTIRMALDSAIAIDAMTPPASDLLKCEYLGFDHSVTDPTLEDPSSFISPAPEGSDLPLKRTLFRLKRLILKEPERSRRVFRLIIANNLAYCDLPASQKPPMAGSGPNGSSQGQANPFLTNLYVTGPDSPASARVLSPEDLAHWQATTIYSDMCMPALGAVNKALARERSVQANLLLTLANALHEREHGQPPETVEELVGPYLKELPEGYFAPK